MRLVNMLFILIVVILLFPIVSTKAEAGVIGRIKDIYEVPERMEELQEQYTATKQMLEGQLEEQRQQLEQSRQQAEELARAQEDLLKNNEYFRQENELYRQRTEELNAENQQLQQRMEQMEQNRKALIRKIIISVSTVVILLVSYAISIRIWRYIVWRRHGRERQGTLMR